MRDDHAALERRFFEIAMNGPAAVRPHERCCAVTRLEWRRLLVRPLAWVLAALTLA